MLETMDMRLPPTAIVALAPWRPLVSLAAFKGQVPALKAALGVELPERPVCVAMGEAWYIWSGPGSWLVSGASPTDLVAARGLAAVTDQSDGRVLFHVRGPHARSALAKLVPIDLRDPAFPIGATALTLAGHIGVHMWRDTDDRFVLACFRSFANSLYDSLVMSCREFES